MKFLFELSANYSHDFVRYFKDHPDETTSFEMKNAFTWYTNDVIATAVFGMSVHWMMNKDKEFYLREKYATSFGGSIWRVIKFIGFLVCSTIMRLLGVLFIFRATYRF